MAKYSVVVRPTGLLNGADWPEAGETVELHEAVGGPMVAAGHLKAVAKKATAEKVEKRPASTAGVETRKSEPAKRAATKEAPAKKSVATKKTPAKKG